MYVRKHAPFLLLLGLFLLLIFYYMWALPPYEGPDEPEHYAYIMLIRRDGRLPYPPHDHDASFIRQEVGQPPLYYLSAAAFSYLSNGFDSWAHEITENPWRGYPAPASSIDNRNQFLMSPRTNVLSANQRAMVDELQWLRLLSPLYGVLMLTGLYVAALQLVGRRSVATFAVLIFALTPQVLQGFAVVSNDVANLAFGAWIVASSLKLYDTPTSRRWLMLAGLFMALAALAKASALVLWTAPAMALALAWLQGRLSLRQMLVKGLLVLALAMLVGGWWYVRAQLLYDDALGITPHLDQLWAFPEVIPLIDTLDRWPFTLPFMWANLGWGELRPGPWAYVALYALLALGALGVLWQMRQPHGRDARLLLLAVLALLGFAAFVRWFQIFRGVYGRLYLPYFMALVLVVAWGLQRWPFARILLGGAVGVTALLVVPFTLRPALGPPTLYDEIERDLQGPVMDFGNIYFLGYATERDTISSGQDWRLDLCWAAGEADASIPVPYPYTITIFDAERRRIGGRETYPGLGTYTRWPPGKAFCDTVQVPITGEVQPGAEYRIWITLFDLPSTMMLPAVDAEGTLLPERWVGTLKGGGMTLLFGGGLPYVLTPIRRKPSPVCCLIVVGGCQVDDIGARAVLLEARQRMELVHVDRLPLLATGISHAIDQAIFKSIGVRGLAAEHEGVFIGSAQTIA